MDTVLSLVVLAAIVLVIAAYFTWRRGGRQQAVLMLILALVGIANVLIWTLPDSKGTSPAEQIEAAKSEGATR
jgi:ABC-type glycerol-3-phosphate transport system permease component